MWHIITNLVEPQVVVLALVGREVEEAAVRAALVVADRLLRTW